MRLFVDRLAGIAVEPTLTDYPRESRRQDVFLHGEYVGQVSYVARKVTRGTEYGWRPTKQTRAKLTTQIEAIRRLPKVATDV